jgi:hypothetical protein
MSLHQSNNTKLLTTQVKLQLQIIILLSTPPNLQASPSPHKIFKEINPNNQDMPLNKLVWILLISKSRESNPHLHHPSHKMSSVKFSNPNKHNIQHFPKETSKIHSSNKNQDSLPFQPSLKKHSNFIPKMSLKIQINNLSNLNKLHYLLILLNNKNNKLLSLKSILIESNLPHHHHNFNLKQILL